MAILEETKVGEGRLVGKTDQVDQFTTTSMNSFAAGLDFYYLTQANARRF